MDRLRALRLLLALGKLGPVEEEQRVALSPGECTVYAGPSPRGAVVMIHGMSPRGAEDARWVQLARGFARAGLTVYAPSLPDVAALQIRASQIDDVERWVGALVARHGGRVGLFSVSFSGGLSLLAAARASVRDHISAVCVLGGFGAVGPVLEYVLTHPDSDRYGRLVVLGNFIHLAAPDPDGWLKAALLGNARDDYHKRPSQITPADRPGPQGALLEALLSDPAAREQHWARVAAGGLEEIKALEVLDHITQIRAPVTLLHGEDDRVIPPTQSVLLGEAFQRIGHSAEVVLTPLISHGDAAVGLLDTLRHAGPLIGAFGRFIGRCRAG